MRADALADGDAAAEDCGDFDDELLGDDVAGDIVFGVVERGADEAGLPELDELADGCADVVGASIGAGRVR